MNAIRRKILSTLLGAGAVMLAPLRAMASRWNQPAFDARSVDDALKYIGASSVADSDRIVLKAPEIAENGAIVPIEVSSRIPGTQTIFILAEKNPQPLAASFDLLEGSEPFIATRIKMAETANLKVVVKAGDKFYTVTREVKVTIGGCGG